MRRTILAALVMTPLTALIVSACVGDDPSTNGDASTDGAAADTTTNDDGAPNGDGSISSDSGIDAAPCTGTWCTCGTAKTASFCDDFDKVAEKLAQGWSYDASFASTDGGVVKLVTTQFESKPRSMNAMVVADNTSRLTAALTENLGDKPTTVAFDLLLDGAGGNCSGQTVDFAQVGIDTSITPSPIASIRFSAANGVPQLGLFTTGQLRLNGDASLPSTWTRVRLTAKVVALDGGGNGITASVQLAPAGSDDALDAAVVLSGTLQLTTSSAATWASLGVLNAENLDPCAVYIDNVAIYQ